MIARPDCRLSPENPESWKPQMHLARGREISPDATDRLQPKSAVNDSPSTPVLNARDNLATGTVPWLLSCAAIACMAVGGLFAGGYCFLTVPAVEAHITQQKAEMRRQPSTEIVFPKETVLVRTTQTVPVGDVIAAPVQSEVLPNEASISVRPEAAASTLEFNRWLATSAFPANPSLPDRAALPRDAAPTHSKRIVLTHHTTRTPRQKHLSSRRATLTPPKQSGHVD
jgi:hypothetical protein